MLGYDIASLADFMPNDWSAWPTTYQRVSIARQTADEVVIETRRDWGDVDLETQFRIRVNDRNIGVTTRMTNNGDVALPDLMTGYVVWPDGGYLFGVPGMHGVEEGPEADATADWSAMYDTGWVLGLHAPFANNMSETGRDRFLAHELQPGESQVFDARIQIEASGDLAPLVRHEISFNKSAFGEISGQVSTADGMDVAAPAVIVYKGGRPYSWSLGSNGRYRTRLPVGEYEIYATAEGHSRSEPITLAVEDGSILVRDFADLQPPGEVNFEVMARNVSDPVPERREDIRKLLRPIDARISIEAGHTPLIEYMGRKIFFTELDAVGEATLSIAPGQYTFGVSAGDGFTSNSDMIEMVVESGRRQKVSGAVLVQPEPADSGWYMADLHHHSDVLDGFTSPEYVLRSQLAAGADIAFLSDHDSTENNEGMRRLAERRHMHFIPGTELSPSWAHFNAYPIDDGKSVDIDTGVATVQQVFGEARRLGADVISVNHPYDDYGYFANLEQPGMVPGGYDRGFDLVEIEPLDHEQTAKRTWQLWNEGHRAYFAAGSDAHDVWNEMSGLARSYVHVEGDLTAEKFIDALRAGHSYATQGPLIFPETMFGSEISPDSNSTVGLSFKVVAVNGLRSVQLIEQGEEVRRSDRQDGATSANVDFLNIPVQDDTWFSVVVIDENDRRAYSNPIWVKVSK
jgi:predicted metal-dependent phosphoesterase TrpH